MVFWFTANVDAVDFKSQGASNIFEKSKFSVFLSLEDGMQGLYEGIFRDQESRAEGDGFGSNKSVKFVCEPLQRVCGQPLD
jgi:hypothetical protein